MQYFVCVCVFTWMYGNCATDHSYVYMQSFVHTYICIIYEYNLLYRGASYGYRRTDFMHACCIVIQSSFFTYTQRDTGRHTHMCFTDTAWWWGAEWLFTLCCVCNSHSLRLKMRHFLLTFDALSPFHSHLNTLYCKSLSFPLTLGLHQSFHCSTSAQQRQLVVSSDTLRLELDSICDTKNCREKYSCIHSFIGTLNVQ